MTRTEINKNIELCSICRSLPQNRCSKKASAEKIWQMILNGELPEKQGMQAIRFLGEEAEDNGCNLLKNFIKSKTEVREIE